MSRRYLRQIWTINPCGAILFFIFFSNSYLCSVNESILWVRCTRRWSWRGRRHRQDSARSRRWSLHILFLAATVQTVMTQVCRWRCCSPCSRTLACPLRQRLPQCARASAWATWRARLGRCAPPAARAALQSRPTALLRCLPAAACAPPGSPAQLPHHQLPAGLRHRGRAGCDHQPDGGPFAAVLLLPELAAGAEPLVGYFSVLPFTPPLMPPLSDAHSKAPEPLTALT